MLSHKIGVKCLPAHLKQLYKTFEMIESNINFMKSRKAGVSWTNDLSCIKEMAKNQGKTVTLSMVRQIMTVAPDFFIHKWDFLTGAGACKQSELFIEIPANIAEVIAADDQAFKGNAQTTCSASEAPYMSTLGEDLVKKRRRAFRRNLITIAYQQCLAQQQKNGVTGFEAFEQWPAYFDVTTVPAVEEATLKVMPKQQRAESVSDFLS
jgi:hypothetical protein